MSNLNEFILAQMKTSFEAKLATLPPPPAGYYYSPDKITDIRKEGENYIIETEIVLKPIIEQ